MTDQNQTIERENRMDDLEVKSPKQTLVLIIFTIFVLTLLGAILYVMLTRENSTPQKEIVTKNKIANNPGTIDMTIEKPEPIVEQPKIIIPEEVVLRPETVTLKDIGNEPNVPEVPKIDEAYMRKLQGGGSLLAGGSSSKIQDTKKTKPFNASVLQAKAGKLGDMNYLITQGTKIHCTMENALDSTIPGYTSCIIARDVYSANGNVILLDRGTKVSGKYESNLQHGQARLYVQWNRAITPEGVVVDLKSGGTGPLGREGHTGQVNKHWWDRFGNALLVSIVGDALGYTSDKTNNENFENTENTINQMVKIAAENGITIKPSIDINQGTDIIIYVQHDLSFENVYTLEYDKDR